LRNTQHASKLADWMKGNIPEELKVFTFPVDHRITFSEKMLHHH